MNDSPQTNRDNSTKNTSSDVVVEPQNEIAAIHDQAVDVAVRSGIPRENISNRDLRIESILYMIYWFHRLRNNTEEGGRIQKNLAEYVGASVADPLAVAQALFSHKDLGALATRYVEHLLAPQKTVDLLVTRAGSAEEKDREILCIPRTYYPLGLALPGGLVNDADEDNELNIPSRVFAALRVAGEKVLGREKARYRRETDARGKSHFVVRGETETPVIHLYPEDAGGYSYRENIKSVLRPSDPRHIVDTVGFRCEIVGDPNGDLLWRKRSDIMSPETPGGGFAFGHHREIVAHITAQTSLEKERAMREREFIRGIIAEPLASYRSFKARFDAGAHSPETSFGELFSVVDRLLADMFSDELNALCRTTPLLAGVRDKAVIALRHVCLKNRTFCPYLPTLRAIAEAVAFFDLAAREKRGFYATMPKEKIVEHDPRQTPFASYHMYRYRYRLDQLFGMVPDEIVIPTFEPLSATDLMRVRGVPIRFIGLAEDFLYVDEFEQSPEEFFMHDCNHSWRMIKEDREMLKTYDGDSAKLLEESNTFLNDYLDRIKVRSTDTETEREVKKIKKIILFEIVHEDARPFLKEVIGKYIQVKEGGAAPFEVPRIDHNSGYMDVVDTLDTGISTLSYVRNKLQHGFYDHIDAQLPQIVAPSYRSAEWIARAAYDMLVELEAVPVQDAERDDKGHVSYEWLLRRTCAVGPDNIHGAEHVDPAVKEHGDGAERLNPKRYQV